MSRSNVEVVNAYFLEAGRCRRSRQNVEPGEGGHEPGAQCLAPSAGRRDLVRTERKHWFESIAYRRSVSSRIFSEPITMHVGDLRVRTGRDSGRIDVGVVEMGDCRPCLVEGLQEAVEAGLLLGSQRPIQPRVGDADGERFQTDALHGVDRMIDRPLI